VATSNATMCGKKDNIDSKKIADKFEQLSDSDSSTDSDSSHSSSSNSDSDSDSSDSDSEQLPKQKGNVIKDRLEADLKVIKEEFAEMKKYDPKYSSKYG